MTARRSVLALLLGLAVLTAVPLASGAATALRPRLSVQPTVVQRGHTLTFVGSGFQARRPVVLYIGPPRSEGDRVTAGRTDARGRFRLHKRLSARMTPGRYVAFACQRACRVKAYAQLRVTVAPPPLAIAASRRPTATETRAIRSAALRSLHGSGWRVTGIRVSTIPGRHRYAKAAADNVSGVGGEMILRRDGTRWRRIFLGTDGFCDVAAPRRVLHDLGFGC